MQLTGSPKPMLLLQKTFSSSFLDEFNGLTVSYLNEINSLLMTAEIHHGLFL